MAPRSNASSDASLVRKEFESHAVKLASNARKPKAGQSTLQPFQELALRDSDSSNLMHTLDADEVRVHHKRHRAVPQEPHPWRDNSLRSSLMHVSGWLKEFGVQHVLVGGTALGMLRQQDVIDGDDDVDIAVDQNDIKTAHDIVSSFGKTFGVRTSHVTYNVSGNSETGTGFRITFADISNPSQGQVQGDPWAPVDIYGFEDVLGSQELCLSPFNRLVNKSWLFPVKWQHAGGSKDWFPMPQDALAYVSSTFGSDWQTPKSRGKDKPRFTWKCCSGGPLADLGTRLLAAGESCIGNYGPSGGFCCSTLRRKESGAALLLLATLAAVSFAAFLTLRRRVGLGATQFAKSAGICLLTFHGLLYLLWSSFAYVTRQGEVSIGLMVLAGQLLRVTISFGLWGSVNGRPSELHLFLHEERHRLWTFVMPAALSALADLLSLDAMQYMDPAIFAALYSMRAIIIVGLWKGFFLQHLERIQWLAFAAMSVGCLLKLREVIAPPNQDRSLLLQVFIASALNAMANLQKEWLVQMEPKDCLHFQALVISLMGFIFTVPAVCIWVGLSVGKQAVIQLFTLQQMYSLSVDPFALTQVLAFAAVGLTGGHVVGQLSNIQHEVALGLFALLAVPVSYALFEHGAGRWSFVAMQLLALAVLISTRSFTKGREDTRSSTG